jgi:hypothetical protein
MLKGLKRLIFYASVAVSIAALLEQLRRPATERTWQGAIFGVPYDFRAPSFQRFRDAWWNPEDPRLFTPRDFGVGWAINLPRLIDMTMRIPRENGDG